MATAQTVMFAAQTVKFDEKFVQPDGTEVDVAQGGVALQLPLLPAGARFVSLTVKVDTAFAGPTTPTASLKLSKSASNLVSTLQLGTAGTIAVTGAAYLSAGDSRSLVVTLSSFSAPATAGQFTVFVKYVVDDRAQEVI